MLLLLLAGLAGLVSCQHPPERTESQSEPTLPTLEQQLEQHIFTLAVTIGERNTEQPDALKRAARYIESVWNAQGYAEVQILTYKASGVDCDVLSVTLPGVSNELIIVGAHYDSVMGSPGADDNATGVAMLLELSRSFSQTASKPLQRSLRFVAFPNEEPPHFETPSMGSRVYARRVAEDGETVVAMISLESLGFFSDEPGSQAYPPLLASFYPDTGNFVGVVGNVESRALVDTVRGLFEEAAPELPVESIAAPARVPGIHWSDHASFWREGYLAVMVTDTAAFRNPHYHEVSDLPDTLDMKRLADITRAMVVVVAGLSSEN